MKKNRINDLSWLKCSILFFCCFTMVGTEAWAQNVPSQPQPAPVQEASPLYIQVMRQWAKITHFPENAAEVVVAKLKMGLEKNPKTHKVLTKQFEVDLKQYFYELFFSEEIIKELAALYSQYFTLDDMLELNKFYQTPLGQKLVKADPQLRIQTQQIGDKLLKSHEKEYLEIIAKYVAPQVLQQYKAEDSSKL